jgi:hypothetical protein
MKLVLCEGQDDEAVIRGLCEARGLRDLKVGPYSGRNKLASVLGELPKRPEFTRQEVESLGITLDANGDGNAAWQLLCDAVRGSFNLSLTERGLFVGAKPRIGGFIVSGPDGKGMLEDLCLASVSDKPGYPCLEAYFRCLTERTGRKDYHSKAKFRAWMASQSQYELYVGKAAVEGYLPFDHAAFNSLAQFLAAM